MNPIPLNKYIKREYFNIPTQEELTAKLGGRKWFTVLDMKEGFHQFVLDPSSRRLCTMATPWGRYSYKRAPYGLSCMPEIFPKENTKLFRDIPGVQVLYDDIYASGATEAEHNQNLEEVMRRARKYQVRFNSSKLQYKSTKVR